jgi:hypothetical protein
LVAQDAFIGCLGQFFNHAKTQRFFAAQSMQEAISAMVLESTT